MTLYVPWLRRVAASVLCPFALGAAQAQTPKAPPPAALFAPVASVLMHPRCLNCHQAEAPRQTDLGVRHTQNVVRGPDGKGAAGQNCMTCHQANNTANGRVPGAKHWHLAPASMNWQGLNAGDICRQLKDPARNGNRRTGAQVIDHMATDPLVLWAWEPGAGRSQPPLSNAELVAALRVWADQGMPCPS